MEKFCVIIPDRGDRPEFLNHCIFQMERQTLHPDKIYVEGPEIKPTNNVDIVPRIKKGIEEAVRNEIDICFIIENDDYYPDNYFEKMFISHFDFIGIPKSIYYYIRSGKIALMEHQTHSALFCTGFRISAMKDFIWPPDDYLSLDLKLWEFAWRNTLKPIYRYPKVTPIGIKHGVGLCGGTSHHDNFPHYQPDPGYFWLKRNVRPESFNFYKSMFNGTPGTD